MKKFSRRELFIELTDKLPSNLRKSSNIRKAFDISYDAHAGQERENRYQDKLRIPYIVHPVGVAILAIINWVDSELDDDLEIVVCVCLLHDAIEDTSIDYSTIAEAISERCALLVASLSKPPIQSNYDRERRNMVFVKNIAKAGPTAIYIKLCDVLHNLKRPQNIPSSLLEKTIDKTINSYSVLAHKMPFQNRMTSLLSEAVANAKMELDARLGSVSNYNPNILEEYLLHISILANSKVLEKHDVINTLLELPGVKDCWICTIEEFTANELTPVNKSITKWSKAIAELENNLEGFGGLELSSKHLKNLEKSPIGLIRLYSIPLFNTLIVNDSLKLILATKRKELPGWFAKHTLSTILSLLTERLALSRIAAMNELAESIRHYSLDLSTALALEHQLTERDLSTIKSYIDLSNFILNTLKSGVETALRSESDWGNVDRVESRVKSVESSLKKISMRNIKTVYDLDDFVGIRLVVLSKRAQNSTKNIITDWLTNSVERTINSLEIDPLSIENDLISTSGGYSAIHLRFKVLVQGTTFKSINCEIQIRTVFEDAWARVAYKYFYKNGNISSPTKKKLIHKMIEAKKVSEEIGDALEDKPNYDS